nr:hypothetical protein [Rhodoferax sp.]
MTASRLDIARQLAEKHGMDLLAPLVIGSVYQLPKNAAVELDATVALTAT